MRGEEKEVGGRGETIGKGCAGKEMDANVKARYIQTPILSPKIVEHVLSNGVAFAKLEDAVEAVLRISCDASINGTFFPPFVSSLLFFSGNLANINPRTQPSSRPTRIQPKRLFRPRAG